MRITLQQRHALLTALHRRFGAGARLWVFGSRTDDSVRGGDYDLLVQCDSADAAHMVDAKLAFLSDLHVTPGFEDERPDVVLYSPKIDPAPRQIHRHAWSQGIELTPSMART